MSTPANARTQTWLLLLPPWPCIFFFRSDKFRRSCSFSAGTAAVPPPRSRLSPPPWPRYMAVAAAAVVNFPVDGLGTIFDPTDWPSKAEPVVQTMATKGKAKVKMKNDGT